MAPFQADAFVLPPDHLHDVWTPPGGDADFSTPRARVKGLFARAWVREGGWEGAAGNSRRRNRRRGVWQPRFRGHVIRR